MRLVSLDFETYYDQEYSLSKMTTAAYIRHPEFEVICLTATVNSGEVQEAWGYEAVRELLLSLELDREDTVTVAQNARFDGTIIEWQFGIRIRFLVCTILMMRETGLSKLIGESLSALAKFLRDHGYNIPQKGHEVENAKGVRLADMTPDFRRRYGGYCRNDTIILRIAAQILLPLCPADALRAMNMTLQMYTRPVFMLDKPLLTEYLATLRAKRAAALQELSVKHGFPCVDTFLKSLRSKPKFAELLRELGIEPPTKVSEKKTATAKLKAIAAVQQLRDPETTPKVAEKLMKQLRAFGLQGDTLEQIEQEIPELEIVDYAFAKQDLEFKELEDHPDDRVVALVTARMENNTSQAESRTEAFLRIDNPMPIPIQYGKAHTNRYGGDEGINVQNLPKRQGDKTLRYSMMAPEGHEVGAADSSQVEARLLAYAAQERSLLRIFETGGDPYCYMAAKIYREPEETIYYWTKGEGAAISEAMFADKDHPSHAMVAKYTRMRNVGKETILGSGYQMSGAKFALRLRQTSGIMLRPDKQTVVNWHGDMVRTNQWPADKAAQGIAFNTYLLDYHLSEAKRINRVYRSEHDKIKSFWSMCEWVLGRMVAGEQGYFGGPDGELFYFDGQHKVFGEHAPGIRLPDGFWLVYPGLRSYVEEGTGYTKYVFRRRKDGKVFDQHIYGGSLTENLIQALAFAVLKWQAVRVHKYVPVKMNVHDEWASVYRTELRDRVRKVYELTMRTSPPWVKDAPLDCEFKYGPNYGRC